MQDTFSGPNLRYDSASAAPYHMMTCCVSAYHFQTCKVHPHTALSLPLPTTLQPHKPRQLHTSYVKSTCPGVSMRLSAYSWPSFAVYRMRAVLSLIVMPRSRSMSLLSMNCSCWVFNRGRGTDDTHHAMGSAQESVALQSCDVLEHQNTRGHMGLSGCCRCCMLPLLLLPLLLPQCWCC